jgi:CTP:molybdopterin cytidylyltransferase MocA
VAVEAVQEPMVGMVVLVELGVPIQQEVVVLVALPVHQQAVLEEATLLVVEMVVVVVEDRQEMTAAQAALQEAVAVRLPETSQGMAVPVLAGRLESGHGDLI